MDTLIFALILATFIAQLTGRRRLAISLFLVSLAATGLLFRIHVSDPLGLSF